MIHEVNKKIVFQRHIYVALFSGLLIYSFYLSYFTWGVEVALFPNWGVDHPFWRAWAHAAFVLLFLTLIITPASKLWHPIKKFISWRREFGIWFAVLSIGHGYAIWDRWARWDIGRLFGFEYVEEVSGYILTRPEVGIMNMMGLIVAPMIILLAVTSFDRVVRLLGPTSWKWLHGTLVHVIFYIIMLRGVLYLFYFFQYSPPNWRIYPSVWFLYVFLGMAVFVVFIQAAAFVKTVLERRNREQNNSVFKRVVVIAVAVMFVMPMTLMTVTVAYFDIRSIKEPPLLTEQTQPQQEYVESFEMVIQAEDQITHIWANSLNSTPYFRQLTETSGEIVSDEIYRYDEHTMFIAELNAEMELIWSKIEDISPEDIAIIPAAKELGGLAEQYGIGEHIIQFPEGKLQVNVISIGEVIGYEAFTLPEGAIVAK